MASTSSGSSSTSAPTDHEYDIFLSFRGEDTRHSFTDHLYKALVQAGIRTFRDNEEIRVGRDLEPKIVSAIKASRASIIVFSENYENSSWCLEELSLILEQKRKCNHFVLAIYYKVDPSDVRNLRGKFSIQAKVGVEGTKWTKDNVKRWKATLQEVPGSKGEVFSGYETTFITDIVNKVYCELDLKHLSNFEDLIGIETRAEAINYWLNHEQTRSPVLAICGMGGSGKTTLAKYIYNSNKQNFQSSSFLEEIENKPGVLLGLQKQLLRDVLGNNIMVSNVSEGTSKIRNAIQRKTMLIVVDDIDDPDILSTLFGQKVFDTKSKIIITTRRLDIDAWVRSISCACRVHKVELLNNHDSVELLSCYAFGSKIPLKGFEELARQFAQYCGGNPLALKVLGSSLPASSEDPWIKNNVIKIWRSRVNSLNSLKGDLDSNVQHVLQKSFESLPCDSHKELFLHIACLFVGEYVCDVEMMLGDECDAKGGMVTLVNRCLLILFRGGQKLAMHKLIQEMARKIVRNGSKDPAQHTRVWHHDECYSLLRKGEGSKNIEGLAFDMREAKQGMRSEEFQTSSLVKIKNLKYLKLKYVKLTGSYKNFPDLRWLSWHGCDLKKIPSDLSMSSLVALNMSFGELKKFEPPVVLNSLKSLDLSSSYKLVRVCDLHRLPNLVRLKLWSCTSLTHVCKTIGNLENLSNLSFAQCPKLFKDLFSCKQPLLSLPQSLFMWSLGGNLFDILPNYIDLKMIRALNLSACPNLKSLPCLPSTLKVLYIDWCTSLEKITFQSMRFTLQKFGYEGCFKLCEIQGLLKLMSIAKLDEADLEHMQWIKAYQDHKVDLVGDVITKGRTFNIQMLYEYGIRSTYLQGIEDQSMTTHHYTSSSNYLSFCVRLPQEKRRIQGLNVTILYRSLGGEDTDMWPPFAKISNKTKGTTWVYNPVVFCKPATLDNDVVWLSYWPITDILEAGDEVHLNIFLDYRVMIVKECGVSLVYMDDGEVEKEEKSEQMKGEEVIGGDLSLFKVTEGGYYLCRHDFFKSMIPDWLFGDNIQITNSRRWRLSRQLGKIYEEYNAFQNPNLDNIKVMLGVNFSSKSEADKIEKAIYSLVGVECVSTHKETGTLYVCGRFNLQGVVKCVTEFASMVQVLTWNYIK